MAGESVGGVVVTINRVITKLSTNDERTGAIAFFIISLLFIVCCVGCQLYIRASPFVQYYVAHCVKKGKEGEEEEEREEAANGVIRLRAFGGLGGEGEQNELISGTAVSSTLSKIRGEGVRLVCCQASSNCLLHFRWVDLAAVHHEGGLAAGGCCVQQLPHHLACVPWSCLRGPVLPDRRLGTHHTRWCVQCD